MASAAEIALDDALDGDEDQKIPADDGVEPPLVEQAAGSGEPARGRRAGAAVHQRKPKPPCRSSRAFGVALIEKRLMRACGDCLALVACPMR